MQYWCRSSTHLHLCLCPSLRLNRMSHTPYICSERIMVVQLATWSYSRPALSIRPQERCKSLLRSKLLGIVSRETGALWVTSLSLATLQSTTPVVGLARFEVHDLTGTSSTCCLTHSNQVFRQAPRALAAPVSSTSTSAMARWIPSRLIRAAAIQARQASHRARVYRSTSPSRGLRAQQQSNCSPTLRQKSSSFT